MSARPRAFTLALALPDIDESWLAAFSDGLLQCADHYGCALVGGDTTRGPLTLSITVFGEVPPSQAPRRSDAILGDDIWVSGLLGAAAFALVREKQRRAGSIDVSDNHDEQIDRALHQPAPRIELGLALREKIHAMIDVSDGLVSDLSHILDASGCGASLIESSLPIHPALAALALADRRHMALAGGDDYELCFTASVGERDAILKAAREAKTLVTRIGTVIEGSNFTMIDSEGVEAPIRTLLSQPGFDHFG
jgi:thiamine-monophosphate kinase